MIQKRKIHRNGIFFYYTIGIVMPCIILGILAFRGIKNDQALVEKEQQRDLLEAGQNIFAELDEEYARIEEAFKVQRISEPSTDNRLFDHPGIKEFCDHNSIVSGTFFLEDNSRFYMHNNGLLFVPEDYIRENTYEIYRSALNLNKGWQFEFIDQSYREAYNIYNSLLNIEKDVQHRGELLSAMARVRIKQGDTGNALILYDSIQSGYGDVFLQNKLPLGLVALHEKSKIYLQLSDTTTALENNLLALQKLANGTWKLGKPSFLDLLSKTEDILHRCRGSGEKGVTDLIFASDELFFNIKQQQQQTEYLSSLLENSGTIIKNTLNNSFQGVNRWEIQLDGFTYLYSIVVDTTAIKRGIIYNIPASLNSLQNIAIEKQQEPSEFSWEFYDRDGMLVASSDTLSRNTLPISVKSPPNLGIWDLKLYPSEAGILSTFVSSGGGLFFFIFILVLIILAFGLIFTIRTIQGEIQLSGMKSTFVSTVSHEFKSPLTSIRHMAEMLDQRRVPSPEREKEYYSVILQQSERLSRLVENILDFSRMEEGRKMFRFEKTDLVALLHHIRATFLDQLSGHDFDIRLIHSEPALPVMGDREALEQVFFNLLDNACKYSDDSRLIEVILESGIKGVSATVRDYGIGIPKTEQDKIFKRFYRVGDEFTQSVKGAGIGLTIVRRIVDAHDGKITIESSPGKGCAFIIDFPSITKQAKKK